ncbi:MAG: MarR family transcriptional regulator [Planctomycetes bacterium]|nr:MarR family transcriptional regulator [Planctomycetota bacterium]
MNSFVERHREKILGVLSCFDRVVITGTLPDLCHAEAMAGYLGKRGIRLFDYPRWAEPLREVLRENAERLAAQSGLEIEFIRRKNFRKEDRIQEIVRRRGNHPGLVHIFSAMEPCPSYRPWHDKKTGKTFLKGTEAKCLHYYFYFIHEDLGLCYLRVPTWAPFRLQFYFNGHNALAVKLQRDGIGHALLDNAFVQIADFQKAQEGADALNVSELHETLDRLAGTYCPIVRDFGARYHWSLMQVEYATDVVFKRPADFQPLYEAITYTALHAVKPENVATFLGRKVTGNYAGEIGNDFHTRIEGTRIRHHMGSASLKLYDKLGILARIECTANDVRFFKHYRSVEQKDGTTVMKFAPAKKSIYSLPALAELMGAATRRYLEFLSAIDDPHVGMKRLDRIARPVQESERTYRGFNLFHGQDLDLFRALVRGEFNLSGFQNRSLQKVLVGKTGPQISRMLKRLRVHGLVRKIRNTYKYYLTHLGRSVTMMSLKLRELVILPALNAPTTA